MSNYFYGTGRRKTSVARVFLKPGSGKVVVNSFLSKDYFDSPTLDQLALKPLAIIASEKKFDIMATIKGGGKSGQAGALSHGLSRALLEFDASLRPVLKQEGLLTRDSRMVERKKTGQPKARKKAQYSKR